MIHGIHHTAISTVDMERALGFYRDLLGFKEVFSLDWDVGRDDLDAITGLHNSAARVAMLTAGNACIELFEYRSPSPRAGDANRPVCDHGITHLCLQVSDVDAEYERLCAQGVRFHSPPQNVGELRATYGRDPDGNVVELLEVPAASAMSIASSDSA